MIIATPATTTTVSDLARMWHSRLKRQQRRTPQTMNPMPRFGLRPLPYERWNYGLTDLMTYLEVGRSLPRQESPGG